MFRTGPLSIIRSISTLYTQQQVFVMLVLLASAIITILMKSVCVVAVYTVCMLMLLSCWPGNCVQFCICWSQYKISCTDILLKIWCVGWSLVYSFLYSSFSTAGPWHQLYRAARGSPGICHFSFSKQFS